MIPIPLTFFNTIIIIEFAIVTITIILAYVFKYTMSFNQTKEKRSLKQLKNYITQCIEKERSLQPQKIKKKWHKMIILINALNYFDFTKNKKSFWHTELRNHYLKQILLPIARKYARSEQKTKRLLAARAFFFVAEKQDEHLIISLMKDQILAIALESKFAALQIPSEKMINSLIDSTSAIKPLGYEQIMPVFQKLPDQSSTFLIKRLNDETDVYKRKFCYMALKYFTNNHVTERAYQDIYAANTVLALSVIDYLTVCPKEEALAILIDLLNDERDTIKIATLSALRQLGAHQYIQQIAELLNDLSYLVRLKAALTLLKLGKQGYTIIKSFSKKTEHPAYQEINRVLSGTITKLME